MANPNIALNDIRPIVISGLPSAVAKTITSGQGTLAAGSVLGVITSGGKLKLTVTGAGDGSQTPKYVLIEAVDATSDVTGVKKKLLASGTVRGSALVFGGSDTLATHFDALKANGITAIDDVTLEAFDNT